MRLIIETGNRPTVKRRANIVMPMQAFMLMLQALNANAQVLAASQQKQVEQAHAALQAQIEEAMGNSSLNRCKRMGKPEADAIPRCSKYRLLGNLVTLHEAT